MRCEVRRKKDAASCTGLPAPGGDRKGRAGELACGDACACAPCCGDACCRDPKKFDMARGSRGRTPRPRAPWLRWTRRFGAYCRLSPHFEDAVALDDAAALPRLAALADRSDVDGAATFLARLLAGDDADAARPRPLGHEALLDGSAGSDLAASALEELVDLAWIDAVGARRRPRTSGAGSASF